LSCYFCAIAKLVQNQVLIIQGAVEKSKRLKTSNSPPSSVVRVFLGNMPKSGTLKLDDADFVSTLDRNIPTISIEESNELLFSSLDTREKAQQRRSPHRRKMRYEGILEELEYRWEKHIAPAQDR
jgi:hypothetical protein